jgi:hypothetical protein
MFDSNKALITTTSGGGAAQDVNIAKINGSTPAMSNPLPVELSDGTNPFGTASNPINAGSLAATALPSAATGGNIVSNMADKFGRQAVVLNSVRDLIGTVQVNSSSSSPVTFIAAGSTGVFNDIITFVATNESATATIVSLLDGSTTYKFALAANGGIVINFPTPLPAA